MGGVACRLRRAAWTRSPGASAPSGMTRGCSSVPCPAAAGSGVASLRWRLSCALKARRSKGVHSPVCARIARLLPPPPPLCSALAVRAARSSHKFWGSPSRLFFNCPQVGRWRLLRTLPSPRPLPLPHHTPTPRRRHANGRSLSWALAVPAPFFWRPGLAGGGRAQRLPATPDRGRWKLR